MTNLIHVPTPAEVTAVKQGWLSKTVDNFVAAISPQRGLARKQARTLLSYDAAQQSRLRPSAQQIPWNTNSVHDQRERNVLMFEAREMSENSGFVAGHQEKIQMYCTDTLEYVPNTGNPQINSEYHAYIKAWKTKAHVAYEYTFEQLMGMATVGMTRDGDSALIWFRDENGLRLEIVEADQIGEWNQYQSPLETNTGYVNGIFLGAHNSRARFKIYDRIGEMQFANPQIYDAENVIFFIHSNRKRIRGITAYAMALNNIRDRYQLLSNEMANVKKISETAIITYTQRGEAPVGEWNPGVMNGESIPIMNDRGELTYIRQTPAGTQEFMGMGEKFEVVKQDRHSPTFQGFLKTLDQDNCHGLNLPYGFLVDPSEPNGAGVRIIAHVAGRQFKRLQNMVLRPNLNKIRDVLLSDAMERGLISKHPNWNKGEWLFPPPPTADVQRESDIGIKEVRAGISTYSQQYAIDGEDWNTGFEQKGEEVYKKYKVAYEITQRCLKEGILDVGEKINPEEIATLSDNPGNNPDATGQKPSTTTDKVNVDSKTVVKS